MSIHASDMSVQASDMSVQASDSQSKIPNPSPRPRIPVQDPENPVQDPETQSKTPMSVQDPDPSPEIRLLGLSRALPGHKSAATAASEGVLERVGAQGPVGPWGPRP